MYVDDVEMRKVDGKQVPAAIAQGGEISPRASRQGAADIRKGLRSKISSDLAAMGFLMKDSASLVGKHAVEHIACGRDCGTEMALLKKLAALKQQVARSR